MDIRQKVKNTDGQPNADSSMIEPFDLNLSRRGLKLEREQTTTLQINIGRLCNQTCAHCHLDAGPDRKEVMDDQTLDEVVRFAQRFRFHTIDITGGAPELHPDFIDIIERLSSCSDRTLVRSNLSALESTDPTRLIEVFNRNRVVVVASLPTPEKWEMDWQSGEETFQQSIEAFKRLNIAGYGREGTGLELNMVFKPDGPDLPPSESQTERQVRTSLEEKWGVVFNNLMVFALVPLGRFGRWLHDSDNFGSYMNMLTLSFRPENVAGLMCRSLISVARDGYLYDCDFNLAAGLSMAGKRTHISQIEGPPDPGSSIATADHCYTCTAGVGFS